MPQSASLPLRPVLNDYQDYQNFQPGYVISQHLSSAPRSASQLLKAHRGNSGGGASTAVQARVHTREQQRAAAPDGRQLQGAPSREKSGFMSSLNSAFSFLGGGRRQPPEPTRQGPKPDYRSSPHVDPNNETSQRLREGQEIRRRLAKGHPVGITIWHGANEIAKIQREVQAAMNQGH